MPEGRAVTAALPPALDALRDIHLPEPIPFWPLAPGWWGLAICALALTALLIGWVRRTRRLSWQKSARAELESIEAAFARNGNAHELAAALSVLLRRAARMRFGDASVGALRGEAWVGLLCGRGAGEPDPASSELVRELTRAAFAKPDSDPPVNPPAWITFARTWIAEAT